MIKHWSNIVTVIFLVSVALSEAINQFVSGTPNVQPHAPAVVENPKINYLPLVLLILAGVVWLGGHAIAWVTDRWLSPNTNVVVDATQTANQGAANPAQYRNVDEFYATYDNVILRETEANIRVQSDQYAPGAERERYLIRYFATVVLLGVFELVWAQIYASQLRALHQLTGRALTLAQLREYYDEGVAASPHFYQNYPYERWLLFLRSWLLILEQGDTIQLAPRGREFLRYLVQSGKDEGVKIG